ncbi:MAG: DUF3040 domain-containing protein [Acidimicrobiales bacterium]
MSTRDDASLTAQERAALARLEAMAAADDPQLAARLKGPMFRLRLVAHRPEVPAWLRSPWLRNRWWGAPAAVAGLVMTLWGLSTTWVLGVVGALTAAFGLWLLAGVVERRWVHPGGDAPPG